MAKFFDSMRREKGSIYSLVSKYYVLFAIAILLLAYGVNYITQKAIYDVDFLNSSKIITSQMTDLENERYYKLNLEKVIGKDGYFEVLDNKANVIFISKSGIANEYRMDELSFIPPVSGSSYYYVETIYKDDVVNGYILHKYNFVKNGEGKKDGTSYGITDIAILDKDRNIIYSNYDEERSHLSENELAYAMENIADGTYLQRFSFVTTGGEERVMLLHTSYTSSNADEEKKIYTTGLLIFLSVFAVLLFIFVLRTIMSVKRPMDMLKNSMGDLTEGKRDVAISYSGPKEFVQIVDAFNDMADKLHDTEEAREHLENERQKMLTYLSYDLNIPITAIKGYTKFALDRNASEEDRRKYIEAIGLHTDDLSEFIDDLGDYAYLEEAGFRLDKSNDDIFEFFRNYFLPKKEEVELIGYSMDVDVPDESMYKSFDRVQIKRVFENLISNALSLNPRGTKLYADISASSNKVVIHIGDDGEGIPEEATKYLFEPYAGGSAPFYGEKRAGLGSSIARIVVEAHGGTIRLMDKAESGHSTMFEIVF
ncbi:HAMP domain-containing sensor histidine kinase [Butyrivibrio sp. WCD3002]|uniref:HAMP domain-containing sensor histidine kinase n=1 Tax=Butyrivibrio sp. WCD3002 TaxID=1280676 RepID=UPI00040DCD6A|nr:HAMP domain-containing sensor histidine kinase [Butyrivibrio sp. WCD3002]